MELGQGLLGDRCVTTHYHKVPTNLTELNNYFCNMTKTNINPNNRHSKGQIFFIDNFT